MSDWYGLYLAISRWILPALSLLIAVFWVTYYRASRPPKRVIARFTDEDDSPLNVFAAEGVIGSHRRSDVCLPDESVEKRHAVFYESREGWQIAPAAGETTLNDRLLDGPAPLTDGDRVTLGDRQLTFWCSDVIREDISSFSPPSGALLLFLLTLFQLVMGGQLCLRYAEDLPIMIPICFGGLIAGQWLYFAVTRVFRQFHLLAEIPVLYLTTLGLAVCAAAAPESLFKQFVCAAAGIVGFLVLFLLLRREQICHRLRFVVAGVTLAVMGFTVLFGTIIFGSRNWLSIAGVSFQPAEFAKVSFLMVGACTLPVTVLRRRNKWFFAIFAALIMLALVRMVDFGAIAIFFVAGVVILLMRLTDLRLIGVLTAAAVAAGVVIVAVYPYIAARFGAWTHAWQYADSIGYQQTRTLIAAASGGMLGVGGGNGYLVGVPAAETDLVFGLLSEEWGGIIALCAALCFVALGVYAVRLAKGTRSAFHAIGVCGAATIMLFQTALNLFGSTDLLPLTGVTMMFVSRGGTSLVAAFLLVAFFKAAEATPRPPETEGREPV